MCPPCSDRFFKIDGRPSLTDDYLAWLDRHSLVPVLGKTGTHRPESGRPMQGVFILPTPLQFDALCADLHRQALVAREQGVPAEEAPGDAITFDVCVRTPYVFEYSNGSLELMTATEASRLLPVNPSLQIDMPQAPAPVIQLDVGNSLFETLFLQTQTPCSCRRRRVAWPRTFGLDVHE